MKDTELVPLLEMIADNLSLLQIFGTNFDVEQFYLICEKCGWDITAYLVKDPSTFLDVLHDIEFFRQDFQVNMSELKSVNHDRVKCKKGTNSKIIKFKKRGECDD